MNYESALDEHLAGSEPPLFRYTINDITFYLEYQHDAPNKTFIVTDSAGFKEEKRRRNYEGNSYCPPLFRYTINGQTFWLESELDNVRSYVTVMNSERFTETQMRILEGMYSRTMGEH